MVRSDAQENRERLLTVARDAFERSPGTSLNQIAQQAGVGPGTLYRHFPTREALVLAVYEQEVDALLASAPALLAHEAPLDALRDWTMDLVRAMRRKHDLGDALSPNAATAVTEATYGPVIAVLTSMLDAGRADGSVRADADAADLLLLTGALWRAGDDGRAERMLELILDGLRRS
jgi:AcrR family transcriptional regulator